jgi:endonuclease/exonuclease/phosphatase family metal-dependent hydrolase
MGAVDSRFVAAIAGTPGVVWSAATGEEQPDAAAYGVALLSRYPVHGWNVLRLPRLPVPTPVRSHDGRVFLGRDEPRVAVTAYIDSPLGELAVTTTHLSFVPGWNTRQLRRVMRALAGLHCPQVLTGDLNMAPNRVARRVGWRSLVDAATFPAWEPSAQLDHVLSDRLSPRERGEAVEVGLSDHRALVAVL